MMIPTFTEEKLKYRHYWQYNSSHFENQGCYEWMASLLQPFTSKRIFDVGCGTGEGLVRLLKDEIHSLVAIDENFPCLDACAEKLEALEIDFSIDSRLMYHEHEDGTHDIAVDPEDPIRETALVNLVHADIFLLSEDKAFAAYVESAEKFDVVTVWLTGAFDMRKTCRVLNPLGFERPSDYRQELQARAYRLADRILRSGGVLHIVDRGVVMSNSPELEQKLLAAHEEKTAGTSLQLHSVATLKYEEPKVIGISMTGPTDSTIADSGEREMHSVILVKSDREN